MEHIEIREMMPEDAEELIACMKKTGGETDNLTFGEEGLPVTIEQERAYLEQMHCAERSVTYGERREAGRKRRLKRSAAPDEPLCRHGFGGGEGAVGSGDRRYAS